MAEDPIGGEIGEGQVVLEDAVVAAVGDDELAAGVVCDVGGGAEAGRPAATRAAREAARLAEDELGAARKGSFSMNRPTS